MIPPAFFRHCFFSTLILFLFSISLHAQGDMRFFGTATKDNKPLPGATVTVLMDGKQIIQVTTGKNGKFKFDLDINHNYRIDFSAQGCVDMYMSLDLHTPPDKAWIYPDYYAEVPFFAPTDSKIKTDLFAQKPFIKVVYDGGNGFYDDPTYRFVQDIFKDPNEELKKQQALLVAQKARQDSIDKANQAEADRLQAIADAQKKADDQKKQQNNTTVKNTTTSQPPSDQQSMETDAITLEKDKQAKLAQQHQNQSIRAQYENNLLKLVAESERQNNLQRYNKMKNDAQTNSVVEVMRREAYLKAQNDYLVQLAKEKQRQTLANQQVQADQLKRLVRLAAQIERDDKASKMKPIVTGALNYTPSPNIVVTTDDGFFCDTKCTVITWPGGKRIIYKTDEYWWGSHYFYRDGKEIDEKTYDEEISKYRHS